ncbi:uncharacterized protein BXZ73DRAFT_102945 [Epithele typhae]|uniref:uncharacterized protein n=1 Tax=Epithele typhae TaxID=378194 RepID=UPI002008D2E1|nr:uncharacterized protein BXZ73DRAFT_102945 [Epithele typhae]KAH9926262.1 hypothetical protein BXZ73DRAFT_102945 [Epithele typhae]
MFAFTSLVVAALAMSAIQTASAAPSAEYSVSESDILAWLATTDAEVIHVGADGEPLPSPPTTRAAALARRASNVNVVWCDKRSGAACGGTCRMYTGTSTCLNVKGQAACLMASANVAFCDNTSCGGSCNTYYQCGTRLDNNFCYTPGTNSINVPYVN